MRKPRQVEVEQRKHSREKLLRAAGNAGSENSASMRTIVIIVMHFCVLYITFIEIEIQYDISKIVTSVKTH